MERVIVWGAVAGAGFVVLLGWVPVQVALRGVAEGGDIYLFLVGMMLLSELARREGLFDWLAARVARMAGGSAARLFSMVYVMGTVVTVFLSNDATAVVMTPAVAAAARAAAVGNPLPYLLVCALVANAASFVLPISNPANLVIYGAHMPSLLLWLPRFFVPSVASLLVTFLVLRFTQRGALRQPMGTMEDMPALGVGGRLAAAGIVVTGAVLLAASACGLRLGLPTFLAGCGTAILVLAPRREWPWAVASKIAWDVLAMVAGLFVLVAGLDHAGLTGRLSGLLRAGAAAPGAAMWAAGLVLGFGCNLINNLPAGLIAGHAAQAAGASERMREAMLIGVDLGPNLSVTGSLATILWLGALRREGIAVTGWTFFKLGCVIMPAALVSALASMVLAG